MLKTEGKGAIEFLGSVTDRTLSGLRLTLAAFALIIVYFIPPNPGGVGRTHVALSLYTVFSLAVYLISRTRVNFTRRTLYTLVCIDLVWYTMLISLGAGTNRLFYFFYLFAIIVASSRGGARFGLLITAVSASLFLAVGLFQVPSDPVDLARFAMRPFALLTLGYVLAYWGGAEIALKRKLTLLNELSTVANPRFGVDWTIELILRRLLQFWEASYCLLLISQDSGLRLYLVSGEDPNRCQKVPVDSQGDVPFIDMSDFAALVYSEETLPWIGRKSYRGYDPRTGDVVVRSLPPGEALAEFLTARSFVSVPLRYRERFRGRIVVSSSRAGLFDLSDAAFLQQVANQALPVIENIRLVERLSQDASEVERNRIARSVHDRVIQPYYGLQIGLKALHSVLNKGSNGAPANETDKRSSVLLSELMAMTADGIDELRQYVAGLKQSRAGDTRLADSIRRFAGKFENATGIHVKVVDNTEGFVGNDRLTSEIFQMASEGLSNVHRHTEARSARVVLTLDGSTICLQVENERGRGPEPPPFRPGSISDRAEALGGRTDVQFEEDRTILRVEVPL